MQCRDIMLPFSLIASLYYFFCLHHAKTSQSFHPASLFLIPYFILFLLPSQFPSAESLLSLCYFLLFSLLATSLSFFSSEPPGSLPTSDVLLARWCMHISCVSLTLTLVDICAALWDSALGHISCNDENDDGDEDSGNGVCVCVWICVMVGWCFYFCPCLFFYINHRGLTRW